MSYNIKQTQQQSPFTAIPTARGAGSTICVPRYPATGTHTALMIEDNLSLCPEYDSRRYLSRPPAALLSSRPDTAESCISCAVVWPTQ